MKRVRIKKWRMKPVSRIIIVCVALFFVVIFCENRAALIPAEFIGTTARSYAQNKVNNVIENKISNFENTYDIMLGEDGELAAVNTNSAAISELKAELSTAVNQSLNGSCTGWVPVGDLLSYRLFSGRGFKIPIKLNFTGAAQVELKSAIESAGINQSKYSLRAVVTGTVYSSSITTPAGAEFSLEFPLCETVIMGDVPSGFLTKQ